MRTLLAALALILGVALLAACGGAEGEEQDAAATTATSAPAGAEAVVSPEAAASPEATASPNARRQLELEGEETVNGIETVHYRLSWEISDLNDPSIVVEPPTLR